MIGFVARKGNYPLTVGIQNEYLSGCIDRRWGSGERYHLTAPTDIDMRVPDEVRKSVLFIGVKDDLPEWEWKGTAYLIALPDGPRTLAEDSESEVLSYPFMLLATARHVAEKLEGKDFALRTNKKDGTFVVLEGHASQKWWYHPTERQYVDAAVTVFTPPNLDDLDIFWVDLGLFVDSPTIAVVNLGVGDEVFLAGLFTEVTETTRNVPIVRIGNLAMMPGEKIPFKDGKLIDAYLVEARSVGGLSGSPVFVRQTVLMQGMKAGVRVNSPFHVAPHDLSIIMSGVGQIFFLGSMIGHWDAPTGFNLPNPEVVNMGISPVVPAHKIKEIIAQPGLQELMQNMTVELRKKKHSNAKEDFAPSKKEEEVFTQATWDDALKKATRKVSLSQHQKKEV